MTTMDFTVGISKINPNPTKCSMLTTQMNTVFAGKGNVDIELNGDIYIQVKNVDGLNGSNITFHLNDVAWAFVQANPIVIAPANGTEGCTPPKGPTFPAGIGFASGTTPSGGDVTVYIPKASSKAPDDYHYWLQVVKLEFVNGVPIPVKNSEKWVHPKIRNDTISKYPMRHPTFHNFLEYPLIALAVIAAVVFVAATLGVLAGNALNRRK